MQTKTEAVKIVKAELQFFPLQSEFSMNSNAPSIYVVYSGVTQHRNKNRLELILSSERESVGVKGVREKNKHDVGWI